MLQILGRVCPDLPHREVAERAGMTPDAFSRSVNDKRQFASVELARIAELTGADLHWLVTGQPDPRRLIVAARHNYDHATGLRSVPSRAEDEQVLADIALAYRQAYPEPAVQIVPAPAAAGWPKSAAGIREELGGDFVRPFAKRLEDRLGIDVVRVKELSTAYSLTVGGRPVIALPATGSWFRENWSIAHELGHLLRGDLDVSISAEEAASREQACNAFAAELLLPADEIRTVDWESMSDEDLARFIWNHGVSTDALRIRLEALLPRVPARLVRWAGRATQRLLRYHLPVARELDEITVRMDEAAQRRFPLALQEAHLRQVEDGAVGKATLAWMLDVDPADLEVDSPEVAQAGTDELASALGL